MKISLINFIMIIGFSLLIGSCGGPKESKTAKLETLTLSAEGPFFEGSNTLQVEFTDALNKFLTENEIPLDDLKEVMIAKCEISVDDTSNLDLISSVNIQLFSDNYPMQNVALLNPVPAGKNKVELQVAEIQEDILEIFKDGSVYVVGDVIIKEEYWDNLSVNCDMEIKVTYKKQEDEKDS